jgi:hypothetical protein
VTREQAEAAHEDRFFDVRAGEDGTVQLRGRLSGEDGAVLLRALDYAREQLREAPAAGVAGWSEGAGASAEAPEVTAGGAEPRGGEGAARADALCWLADAVLAVPAAQRTGGDRHQVVVHIDAETLVAAAPGAGAAGAASAPIFTAGAAATPAAGAAGPGDTSAGPPAGRCELADGAPVAVETVQRLCCDAGVVAIVEDAAGAPLSVGRKTRAIPPAIRRALQARQTGCAFPGCTRTRWLDAHHIEHWAHGGQTSLENLVQLCRRHHRLVHEGGFRLSRASDGAIRVHAPTGDVLQHAPAPPTGRARALLEHRPPDRPPVDPNGPVPLHDGTPWSLEDAVEGLLRRDS